MPKDAPGKPPSVFAVGVEVFAVTRPGVNVTSEPGIIVVGLGAPSTIGLNCNVTGDFEPKEVSLELKNNSILSKNLEITDDSSYNLNDFELIVFSLSIA